MRYSLLFVSCVMVNALQAESIPGIGPVGKVEKVQGGFSFTEGPAWDGNGNLYFTDIPENRIHKLSDGKITIFTDTSRHSNGLMFNAKGELFACEMDGTVVKYSSDGKKRTVLADKYNGKRFNAPNDLVLDQSGGLYFTDPMFRAPKPWPQGKTCVYYVSAKGKVTRLIDDLPNPNGVIMSPDEKTLYVIPSSQKQMMAYPIKKPGVLGKGKVLCEVKQRREGGNGGGDGLSVDTKGNLYITTGLGVQVVSPKGEILGIIKFPEQPANCTFGGKDNDTLYATARKGLYKVKLKSKGHHFPGAE